MTKPDNNAVLLALALAIEELEANTHLLSNEQLDHLDMIIWSEFKEREFELELNKEAKNAKDKKSNKE